MSFKFVEQKINYFDYFKTKNHIIYDLNKQIEKLKTALNKFILTNSHIYKINDKNNTTLK